MHYFIEHFEFCCSAVLAVCTAISLVVAIFRKTKFFRFQSFVDYLSSLIALAESLVGDGNGRSKFDIVFRSARSWLDDNHIDLSDEDLTRFIEDFLSTPEKKK